MVWNCLDDLLLSALERGPWEHLAHSLDQLGAHQELRGSILAHNQLQDLVVVLGQTALISASQLVDLSTGHQSSVRAELLRKSGQLV